MMLEQMEAALEKAKNELSYAIHLEECGGNAGIRKMNANKADWLKCVVYLAELGLNTEKLLAEQAALASEEELIEPEWSCEECSKKDKLIEDLRLTNEKLTEHLKSLQLSYDCEVEYRKALAQRAKIDHFTEVLRLVHDRCWLDGTVLVTPVEYLDRCLLELIKE